MTLRKQFQLFQPKQQENNTLVGIISDFQRFSIHDGEGIRTIVFFKGCPLQCLWCQNPENIHRPPEIMYIRNNCIGCGSCVEACPEKCISFTPDQGVIIDKKHCSLPACGVCQHVCYANAINICGRYVSVAKVMDEVERDKNFYIKSNGGVTFSGGEPFFQPLFLQELAKEAHRRNISTAVETCGYAKWETMEPILPHLDMILFDIKHMDSTVHKKLTGVENTRILENLRNIDTLNIPIRVRLPLIPGFNDTPENLAQTAAFASSLSNIIALDILPYHRMGEPKWNQLEREYALDGVTPHTKQHVLELVDAISSYPLTITIGG